MTRLFVSDVHLDAAAPEATERFLMFLRTLARSAQALYVLGDLFESWVGDDDCASDKRTVCAALHELTGQGVALFVMHGNRDFLLGEQFCRTTGARLLPDPVVAEFDREPVLLTHGDALCTDDHAYQELRSVVRDRSWQRRFLSLPLADRALLAGEARAGSRRHVARVVPYVMDVNPAAVTNAMHATGVKRLIHGHTHRPGIHELVVDGGKAQRIGLGAWYEQGSYLALESGEFQLCELS